jgi:murein DD-endopeptidase MepM/ murein hydrolase activator NlpD
VVALVGSTGLSTGPHLHYMVKKNGQALDPTKFILD